MWGRLSPRPLQTAACNRTNLLARMVPFAAARRRRPHRRRHRLRPRPPLRCRPLPPPRPRRHLRAPPSTVPASPCAAAPSSKRAAATAWAARCSCPTAPAASAPTHPARPAFHRLTLAVVCLMSPARLVTTRAVQTLVSMADWVAGATAPIPCCRPSTPRTKGCGLLSPAHELLFAPLMLQSFCSGRSPRCRCPAAQTCRRTTFGSPGTPTRWVQS